MERIRALINKLHEQSEQHADVSAMMATVQMLQVEMAHHSSTVQKQMGSTKVSVVFPSNKMSSPSREYFRETRPEDAVHKAPPPSRAQPEIPAPVKAAEKPKVAEEPKAPEKKVVEEPKKEENYGWLFDPVHEIPTLAHQKEFKEMNDVFGEPRSSLNDKLKSEKKELASVLHETPVRDLKKAIGVNDRFVFLSELFRGDEAMYERSIKTINNFRIYPEAEYWIERELKVKLGWDENKEAVKVFRKLIKRRFS